LGNVLVKENSIYRLTTGAETDYLIKAQAWILEYRPHLWKSLLSRIFFDLVAKKASLKPKTKLIAENESD
ncbi:hypothetical protein, partial [Oenococcus oeni]|uniref:hypothetical protein n=1 Tax=Oenococcus oeni TaxID=1247 RepID=UPI001C5BF128